MRIFNLENAPKGKPAKKCECVVIGTWEEWEEVVRALEAAAVKSRSKRLRGIVRDFSEHLAVF